MSKLEQAIKTKEEYQSIIDWIKDSNFPVAGVTFDNRQDILKFIYSMHQKVKGYINPDPTNQYDPNCLQVKVGIYCLGYVSKNDQWIFSLLKNKDIEVFVGDTLVEDNKLIYYSNFKILNPVFSDFTITTDDNKLREIISIGITRVKQSKSSLTTMEIWKRTPDSIYDIYKCRDNKIVYPIFARDLERLFNIKEESNNENVSQS